jgi:hypothetical protein
VQRGPAGCPGKLLSERRLGYRDRSPAVTGLSHCRTYVKAVRGGRSEEGDVCMDATSLCGRVDHHARADAYPWTKIALLLRRSVFFRIPS